MEVFQVLMALFYVFAAILGGAAVLLFFKLNIKDVFIKLSNKVDDDIEVAVPDSAANVEQSINNMAKQQNLTTMLDNKGRTVLLDEPFVPPVAAPAGQASPNAVRQASASNPNFQVIKDVIGVDTNEVI